MGTWWGLHFREALLWPCLPLVETQALSRAGGTSCQLSLGTSSHGTEVRDEDHQVPAAGDQPLCDGEQASLGAPLQNWGRGELSPCPSPLREGRVFPTFCFAQAAGKQSRLPELSLRPGRLSPAASIAPPPADRLLVSQGCHPAAALSQPGGRLEGESKGCCRQNGWFSAKRYLLLSEQKREDGPAAVALVAGRVVGCRWDQ